MRYSDFYGGGEKKMVEKANIEVGKTFWNAASGKWAGEQLLKALQSGKGISPAALRTLDTLRKDEWIAFDEALVEEGMIRLRGVADLMAAGLTIPVANAMGKTVFQYEKVSDMNPALVSMDGAVRTENDRQEFDINSLPLPITHKDFFINLRTLTASRERGESLDTTQVRTAGRLVSEETERMLFLGGKTFGGNPIYGYTNHPDRNTVSFVTNGNWVQAAKTGENILEDVLLMIETAQADRMYGPYWLYVPQNSSVKLEEDFKANSDKTIRQRIMEIDGIRSVRVVDQLTANNIILVQATVDVTCMVEGIPLQTIQWDIEGGFVINFKAFTISIPLIRSDNDGRSGVVHMT
jgi:uncharacterized linocin/CFP29 family protein